MHSPSLRSARSLRLAVPVLIALLSVTSYVVTRAAIRSDRDAAAERRAQVASVRTQGLLGRARAYIIGLGNALADERSASQRRFAQLEGTTAKSVGLTDAQWVQRVPRSGRTAYERLLGAPIVRPAASGRFEPAPAAAAYLPATFTTRTGSELRRGIDVLYVPALAAAIGRRASIFATTATGVGALGGRPGFYLVQAGRFGPRSGGDGFLAVFVPRGWLTVSTPEDPRGVMVSLDGRRLEGEVDSTVAHTTFDTLGRRWRIDVDRAAPSGLQSVLPWVALGWPIVPGLAVLLVGRAVVLRRRAQRTVDRIFDVSPDLLASAGFDGFFKRVNPAFERVLGYSDEEFLSRPFLEFVHPDDRDRTAAAARKLNQGLTVLAFENRYICKDGSHRWIQWTARPAPEEGALYVIGRDVTERRRAEDEHAALRRVATLVAQRAPSPEVFAAVAREVGLLVDVDTTYMARYEPDGAATGVASWSAAGDELPIGVRFTLEGENVGALVLRTGRPARIDGYENARGVAAEASRELGLRSSAGAPIVVDERLWGVMIASLKDDRPLDADTEARIAAFTELVATAISNTEARADVERLADEQAALRRVATLVAEGAVPSEVFETVTREVGVLCGADLARMERYAPGDCVVGVAAWSRGDAPRLAVGTRFSLEGASIAALVHDAIGPVRVDSFADAHGPLAQEAQRLGIRSSVGCPIVVEGRLWGVIAASCKSGTPFAPGTESQIAEFTELVATAIANADARAELVASRTRLLTAADDARRRVVRDLHDGAQARLVQTVITLKLARAARQEGGESADQLVDEALDQAQQANNELRELAHGIVPLVLARGGLRPGINALVSRISVPVDVDVAVERLPAEIEASAYFIVAEALTNVVKHAGARSAQVKAWAQDGVLHIDVRDDGVGGARPGGAGLLGLNDRATALGGRLQIDSPPGRGTRIVATLPL